MLFLTVFVCAALSVSPVAVVSERPFARGSSGCVVVLQTGWMKIQQHSPVSGEPLEGRGVIIHPRKPGAEERDVCALNEQE